MSSAIEDTLLFEEFDDVDCLTGLAAKDIQSRRKLREIIAFDMESVKDNLSCRIREHRVSILTHPRRLNMRGKRIRGGMVGISIL